MKDYYQRSMRALQLAGMSERTQQCYTRAVRQLVDFSNKTPDQISELELEDYFLHTRNVDKWSAATMRIAYSGIKFFFLNVLKRDWHIFNYLNAKRERRLPCILSKEEVFRILDHVTTFHNYTFLSTVYACGLRISEALNLHVSDIDSQRMMVHVHRGKGAKACPELVEGIATCHFLMRPLACFGAIGSPTETPFSSFPPWEEATTKAPQLQPPWPSTASREPFAGQSLPPASTSDAFPFTPSAIAMPPTYWRPASTPESSNATWVTANSKPP